MKKEIWLLLYDAVIDEFAKKTGKYLENTPVLEFWGLLAQAINQELKISEEIHQIKRSTLYKNLYLPIKNKEIDKITLNSSYSDALAQFIGYDNFSDFAKKQTENETLSIFKKRTIFMGYTSESRRDLRFAEESKIQKFLLIFEEGNKVRIQSVRNKYSGIIEKQGNNLYIDVTKDNDKQKSEVVMFIGNYDPTHEDRQDLILLGLFSETDSKGNPLASRVIFVKTEEEQTPVIYKEIDENYTKEIPSAIRAYLSPQADNIIEVTESRNMNMADLSHYENIARRLESYAGIYSVYFYQEEKQGLIKVHFQIFPSGRVAYKGREKQSWGYSEIMGGNLYVSLTSPSMDKRSMFIFFIGSVPTAEERVYKGIYSTVGYNFMPHSREGIAVFQPKKGNNAILTLEKTTSEEVKEPDSFEKDLIEYFKHKSNKDVSLESTQKRFTKEEFQELHKKK